MIFGRFLLLHDAWLVFSYGGSSKGSIRTTGSRCKRSAWEFVKIRIHVAGAHRVFYVATRPEALYVLHAFEKRTQKTSAHDLRIGRDRFGAVGKLRHRHGKEERG